MSPSTYEMSFFHRFSTEKCNPETVSRERSVTVTRRDHVTHPLVAWRLDAWGATHTHGVNCHSRNCRRNFCRAMLRISAAYAIIRWLSVRVSVRVSVTFVDSVSSDFFQREIVKQFSFFLPNLMTIFWRETPNGGVECRWGRLKSRFSTNIWLCDR